MYPTRKERIVYGYVMPVLVVLFMLYLFNLGIEALTDQDLFEHWADFQDWYAEAKAEMERNPPDTSWTSTWTEPVEKE